MTFSDGKILPINGAPVVYFDQILGAACTKKLVKTFFSAVFQAFLFISNLFQNKLTKKDQNQSKNAEKHYKNSKKSTEKRHF